jgi:prepilin-type N-terminal cleavage/methylation domain-containing protein
MMIYKREEGFTLIELMVVMVIFVLVIAASSSVFTGLLTQFKQQSKIAETNIEGIAGLEILRRDIESAGYGLPWNVTGGVSSWAAVTGYFEAASVVDPRGLPNPADFNDGAAGTGTGGSAPRPVVSSNNISGYAGVHAILNPNVPDYLVIKSMSVSLNAVAQRFTWLRTTGTKAWTGTGADNFIGTNHVVTITTGSSTTPSADQYALVVVPGVGYFDQFSNIAVFQPTTIAETRIVYGVDDGDLRMPFNRADYYIANVNRPAHCAPNTGVLYKATVNHNGGGLTELPLLDCVASMQVAYGLDNNEDGVFENGVGGDTYANAGDIGGLTAGTITRRVKEIRVYILAHEGQMDPNYTHATAIIRVGDAGLGIGEDVVITGTNLNYRWKLYTIITKPVNMRN